MIPTHLIDDETLRNHRDVLKTLPNKPKKAIQKKEVRRLVATLRQVKLSDVPQRMIDETLQYLDSRNYVRPSSKPNNSGLSQNLLYKRCDAGDAYLEQVESRISNRQLVFRSSE